MNQIVTKAIILRRTNYAEADRIVSCISKTDGKLSAIAKGVRRMNSKLASGIELFVEAELVLIQGRGSLLTLRSSKVTADWSSLAKDLDKATFGFELLKITDRIVEQGEGADLYPFIEQSLSALHKNASLEVVKLWYAANLLLHTGHAPNLRNDATSKSLTSESQYSLLIDQGVLSLDPRGELTADHIKLMRLAVSTDILTLNRVKVGDRVLQISAKTMWDFMKFTLQL